MAQITLEVVVDDMTNDELEGVVEQFTTTLTKLCRESKLPGTLYNVSELDRSEDEEDEEED
jgi:hypothetical protein